MSYERKAFGTIATTQLAANPIVHTQPAILITRRDRDRGPGPLFWAGLGLIGIGLFLIYKK